MNGWTNWGSIRAWRNLGTGSLSGIYASPRKKKKNPIGFAPPQPKEKK